MIGEIIGWNGANFSEELTIYKDGVTYICRNNKGIKLFKHFEEIDFNENFSKLFEMDEMDSKRLFWKLRQNFGYGYEYGSFFLKDKNDINDFLESLSIIYEAQGAEEALMAWEIWEKTGLDLFIAAASIESEE